MRGYLKVAFISLVQTLVEELNGSCNHSSPRGALVENWHIMPMRVLSAEASLTDCFCW